MSRKRMTQIFPFILPIRVMQRKICFYVGMRYDGRHYAETVDEKQLLLEGNRLASVNTAGQAARG